MKIRIIANHYVDGGYGFVPAGAVLDVTEGEGRRKIAMNFAVAAKDDEKANTVEEIHKLAAEEHEAKRAAKDAERAARGLPPLPRPAGQAAPAKAPGKGT